MTADGWLNYKGHLIYLLVRARPIHKLITFPALLCAEWIVDYKVFFQVNFLKNISALFNSGREKESLLSRPDFFIGSPRAAEQIEWQRSKKEGSFFRINYNLFAKGTGPFFSPPPHHLNLLL